MSQTRVFVRKLIEAFNLVVCWQSRSRLNLARKLRNEASCDAYWTLQQTLRGFTRRPTSFWTTCCSLYDDAHILTQVHRIEVDGPPVPCATPQRRVLRSRCCPNVSSTGQGWGFTPSGRIDRVSFASQESNLRPSAVLMTPAHHGITSRVLCSACSKCSG